MLKSGLSILPIRELLLSRRDNVDAGLDRVEPELNARDAGEGEEQDIGVVIEGLLDCFELYTVAAETAEVAVAEGDGDVFIDKWLIELLRFVNEAGAIVLGRAMGFP